MKTVTLIKLSLSFSIVLGLIGAGSVFYAGDASALRGEAAATVSPDLHADEPTAATIAAWKATARASDYLSPQVPI
jgi:hypothetical protein